MNWWMWAALAVAGWALLLLFALVLARAAALSDRESPERKL